MKLSRISIFTLSLYCTVGSVQAATLPTSDISGKITDSDQQEHTTYTSASLIRGTFTIRVASGDVGRLAPLYLVAQSNNNDWYMRDEAGQWQDWDQKIEHLIPATTKTLAPVETINALADVALPAGNYSLLAGYGGSSGDIYYNQDPVSFIVFEANSSRLHRLSSANMLESYLKDGLQQDLSNSSYYINYNRLQFETDTSTAGQSPPETSSTTLQEAGVDEADRIKNHQDMVYVVGTAPKTEATIIDNGGVSVDEIWPGNPSNKTVLRSYQISEEPAAATKISTLDLDELGGNHTLYLAADRDNEQSDLLIAVGTDRYDFGYWLDTWYWREGKTELQFIDASNPSALEKTHQMEISGSLVASRRIGETLYLVTRFSPTIPGIINYPTTEEDVAQNQTLLENVRLEDLLPKIESNEMGGRSAVAATDCYIAPMAEGEWADPSIVTITAIPLSDPDQYKANCIVGTTDALYMSPSNLYLATTQYAYQGGGDIALDRIAYQENHTTLIHKFAINTTNLDYRGSGEVAGHLGWDQNKKSFRFGEHEERLHVATSIGETWTGTSSTRLAVLEEDSADSSLKEVGHLDHLGKPGEKLYASRFFGDQGYLVTFRTTDPLYILDLSNPTQPTISGELNIDGYSDYLFPIAQGYLLGVGKDAVADTSSTDFAGRGAWYQGVKLSLFDVTNPMNPTEVNAIVLGKRGTESPALLDHHAYTFLPASEDRPARVTIPLSLHESIPQSGDFDVSQPNAWYNWTHTGLYGFEIDLIDSPKIRSIGKLIVENSSTGESYQSQPDRALMVGDSLHYFHGEDVFSSDWGALEP